MAAYKHRTSSNQVRNTSGPKKLGPATVEKNTIDFLVLMYCLFFAHRHAAPETRQVVGCSCRRHGAAPSSSPSLSGVPRDSFGTRVVLSTWQRCLSCKVDEASSGIWEQSEDRKCNNWRERRTVSGWGSFRPGLGVFLHLSLFSFLLVSAMTLSHPGLRSWRRMRGSVTGPRSLSNANRGG